VNAATKALNTFVTATATKDVDLSGTKDAADITAAKTKAVTDVAADFSNAAGVADTSAATLYTNTTSADVRAALVTNQQTINAQALADAQTALAADNAKIAKVAGLSDAVATLTAAQASLKAANTADLAAQADLAAKEASFGVNNGGTLTVAGGKITLTVGGTATDVATIGTDGKATVSTATSFDASKYVGLTEMVASFNADVTTSNNVAKATDNVTSAQLAANLLDVAADANTITVATGTYAGALTETALIAKIAAIINGDATGATTNGTVAAGATPTLAQIQTELAVLKADTTKPAAYTDFKALVDAEAAAGGTATLDATFNPLLAKQAADAKVVADAGAKIADLSKDVAALQTASANADTLAGLKATVDAYNKVLTDKGYAVVTLDANHLTNFAGATSDVYVVSNKDASIGAFGLQGTDQLFVGTGYTLVQGAIGATGVKGNDAALEIFVSNNNGDTVLQIENHAYSSAVVGGTGEIVTITLTGVDASHIKLDSTGIITAPAA
jgi:hypothetical protein